MADKTITDHLSQPQHLIGAPVADKTIIKVPGPMDLTTGLKDWTAKQVDELNNRAKRDHPMLKIDTETNKASLDTDDLGAALVEIEKRSDAFDAAEWDLLAQFCAKWTLRQVATLDARWGRLIDAARVETNCEDWQLVGRWIARVLETGQHLNAPYHPWFAPGTGRLVEKKCEWPDCNVMFKPEWAGQLYHDNSCGTKAFNEQRQSQLAREKAIADARPKLKPAPSVATRA